MTRLAPHGARSDPATGRAAAAFLKLQLWRLKASRGDRHLRMRRLVRAWRALWPTLQARAELQVQRENLHPSSTDWESLRSALRWLDGFPLNPPEPSARAERRWQQRARTRRPRSIPEAGWTARLVGLIDGALYESAAVITLEGPAEPRELWVWSVGRIDGPTELTDAAVRIVPHGIEIIGDQGTLTVTGLVAVEPGHHERAPRSDEVSPAPWVWRRAAIAVAQRGAVGIDDDLSPCWDAEADALALALALLRDPDDAHGDWAELVDALEDVEVDVRAALPEAVARWPALCAAADDLARLGALSSPHLTCLEAFFADPASAPLAEALAVQRGLSRRTGLEATLNKIRARARWDYEVAAGPDWPAEPTLVLHGTSGHYDQGQTLTFTGVTHVTLVNQFSHPAFQLGHDERDGTFTLTLRAEANSSDERALTVRARGLRVEDPDHHAPPPPPPITLPTALRDAARALTVARVHSPPLPPPRPWLPAPLVGAAAALAQADPTWRALLAAASLASGPTDEDAALAAVAPRCAALAADAAPASLSAAALTAAIIASLSRTAPWWTGLPEDSPGAWRELTGRDAPPAAARRAGAALLRDAAAEVPERAHGWLAEADRLTPPDPTAAERRDVEPIAAIAVARHALGLPAEDLTIPAAGPGRMLADPAADALRSPDERLARAAAIVALERRRGADAPSYLALLPNPDDRQRAVDAAALLVGRTDRLVALTDATLTHHHLTAAEVSLIVDGRDEAARLARLLRAALDGHPLLRM
jgi:hypothetical protein